MEKMETAKSTIITVLKEMFPSTHFQLAQQSESQFSYIGDLGPNVFDEFTNQTKVIVTYNIYGTVVILVGFDKILYNNENIYKTINTFNENCLYGGMHISEGVPFYKFSAVCRDTELNLKTPIQTALLLLPKIKPQIGAITKFTK